MKRMQQITFPQGTRKCDNSIEITMNQKYLIMKWGKAMSRLNRNEAAGSDGIVIMMLAAIDNFSIDNITKIYEIYRRGGICTA